MSPAADESKILQVSHGAIRIRFTSLTDSDGQSHLQIALRVFIREYELSGAFQRSSESCECDIDSSRLTLADERLSMISSQDLHLIALTRDASARATDFMLLPLLYLIRRSQQQLQRGPARGRKPQMLRIQKRVARRRTWSPCRLTPRPARHSF